MFGPNHERNLAKKERKRAQKLCASTEQQPPRTREAFATTTEAVPAVDHVPSNRQRYLEEIFKKVWSLGESGDIPFASLLIEVNRKRNFDFFNTTLCLEDKLTPNEMDAVILAIHHRARRMIRASGGRVSKLKK